MRVILGILLICSTFVTKSQYTYSIDQTIPVKNESGINLTMPWAGGLNAAQYNTLDINGDNLNDLVLFDRIANKVITFLNEDGQYKYAPEFENLFPSLTNWLLLRDYNCDGKKDIFTGDPLGIRVFTNITQPGDELTWEQFLFYAGPGNEKSQVLLTKGFLNLVNLQLQFDDLPSITDIDGDGDLDILSMRYQGEGSVEFHQNFSKELNGSCDSLTFERVTLKWGNFLECDCGVFAFNGEACPPSSGGRIQHAGGKAMLAMDIDNDQDQDLLFSEAQCTDLFLLVNEGDGTNAVFTNAINFPAGKPAQIVHFPAPFYEDVNFDNINDLIVVPNLFSKDALEIDLKKSNWYYQNTATNQLPAFEFVQDDFLQNKMIDVGDNAVPALYDLDGDGDEDMIIGNNADALRLTGSIFYYENVGTPIEPDFQFVTDDYLDIGELMLINIKPQFADANTDGKTDLVLTATSLITGQTNLYYLMNKTSDGVDFSGQLLTTIDFSFLYSENIHLTDVNVDGIADILIGKSNGSVEYWKNNGPKGFFDFTLIDNSFKELGPSVERQSLAIASGDLNDDGKPELLLGDQFGTLSIINDYRSNNESEILTDLIFNPLTEEYNNQNLGGRIWPTVGNLYNLNKPEIVIGNILGGLQLLLNDEGVSLPGEPIIKIYPVPVEHSELLNVKVNRLASVQLLSALGQELSKPVIISPNQDFSFAVNRFAAGIYILRLTIDDKTYAKRIVIY